MRYFLDTEFIEDGVTIDLLSIGIVCESGEEFYGENLSADLSKANDWVKENVLPHLGPEKNPKAWRGTHSTLAVLVKGFIDETRHGEKPEFWGYYADYDWVAFCQLFGEMIDLPEGFPMYCRDIKQWCDDLGNPQLPEQNSAEHNALYDARWNAKAWRFLAQHKTL